jgi:hypothetical protein
LPLRLVWASTVFTWPRLKTPPTPEPARAVVVVTTSAAAAAERNGQRSLDESDLDMGIPLPLVSIDTV